MLKMQLWSLVNHNKSKRLSTTPRTPIRRAMTLRSRFTWKTTWSQRCLTLRLLRRTRAPKSWLILEAEKSFASKVRWKTEKWRITLWTQVEPKSRIRTCFPSTIFWGTQKFLGPKSLKLSNLFSTIHLGPPRRKVSKTSSRMSSLRGLISSKSA